MAYRLLQTMRKMDNQILLGPRHCTTMDKSRLYHNIVNGSARKHPIHSLQTRWLQFVSNASKEFGKRFYMNDGARPANAEPTVWFEYKYKYRESSGPIIKKSGSDGDDNGDSNGDSNGNRNGEKKRRPLVAMVVGAALCYYAFRKMAYHEIGWQEFVLFYLSKGQVTQLEVVNKKWVRVLLPGQSAYSKTIWFNIGSVDSFDRNLESAQLDLGFDRLKFVPVLHKHEMEMPSTWGVLPTILFISAIIYTLRNC